MAMRSRTSRPAASTPARLPTSAPLGVIPKVPATEVVTRYDIRELSPEMQARVCDGIEKMMERGWAADDRNKIRAEGPWTLEEGDWAPSEYFRLARYHGWDRAYCTHGNQTFPGWHRAYLIDFERTLQAADRALGGDGRIGLPYWGWDAAGQPGDSFPAAVNGQVFPTIVRQRFSTLPPHLIPKDMLSELTSYGLSSDSRIVERLRSMQVGAQTQTALAQWEHPRAASTHAGNANSVETPHNSIHVVCGWPMSSVTYAAFHPIFFFHHCNVDRVYEAYVKKDMANAANGSNAPWNEFVRSSAGMYDTPLNPFRHPATGEPFLPRHTFVTEALGFVYDKLPAVPAGQQLREAPTLARFEDVDPVKFPGRSIALHVFAVGANDPDFTPPQDPDDFPALPQYAGLTGVFGGKGSECENCKTRDDIDLELDISECLKRQGLSRHTARLVVAAVDMNDENRLDMDMGALGLPQPQFAGPFFEDKSLMLGRVGGAEDASAVEAGEVKQLQTYLQKYGWYAGEVDGFFGPATEAAVRRFQTFYGLKVDGIAGPATRTLMMMPRMDDKEDEVDTDDRAVYTAGQAVRWWAGGGPYYLDEEVVRYEVAAALAEWSTAVPLSFVEVASSSEADLVVTFGDRHRDNIFRFDGPGGSLAFASPGCITLDSTEHWLLQAAAAVPGGFYIQPVVLHEIGHALGLTHSNSSADVMSSFYVPGRLHLSQGDRRRAAAIYPMDAATEELFGVLDQDRDGLLSREEFLRAVCGSGAAPLERPEAEALFDSAHAGGAVGGITLPRFVGLMAKLYFE